MSHSQAFNEHSRCCQFCGAGEGDLEGVLRPHRLSAYSKVTVSIYRRNLWIPAWVNAYGQKKRVPIDPTAVSPTESELRSLFTMTPRLT